MFTIRDPGRHYRTLQVRALLTSNISGGHPCCPLADVSDFVVPKYVSDGLALLWAPQFMGFPSMQSSWDTAQEAETMALLGLALERSCASLQYSRKRQHPPPPCTGYQ
jgi:hypothetical protein